MQGLSKRRFEQVFHEGLRTQNVYFRVYLQSGTGKIGIATAKSLGCKPRRNRVKRRLREMVRQNPEIWNQEFDFILLGMPSLLTVDFAKARQEMAFLVGSLKTKWKEKLRSV